MKAPRKISYRILAWLLACICVLQAGFLTAPALAASSGGDADGTNAPAAQQDAGPSISVPYFADVPADAPCANDVYELAQAGILFGTEPDKFSPDGSVTGLQVLVTCHRMLHHADPDIPVMLEEAVDSFYVSSGIDVDWDITKEQAVALLLRRLGALPACNNPKSVIYTDRQGYDYAKMVGEACGLFTLDYANSEEVMTRKEYAMLLNRFRHLYFERPELFEKIGFDYIPVTCTEPYEKILPATWGYILNVPVDVLKAFHQSGYSVCLDNEPLIKYREEKYNEPGMDIVGLFSTSEHAIFVKTPYAVMHEMGHFVEKFMSGIEMSERFYKLEAGGCEDLLGDYAKTNHREYFGEAFRFFIRNRNDLMQMDLMRGVMPKTYQYMLDLEANHWFRPGLNDFLTNNFALKPWHWFNFD